MIMFNTMIMITNGPDDPYRSLVANAIAEAVRQNNSNRFVR